ncbi:MAG: HRDC domain-containing protein [Acidimicrobiales bacterium]
MSVPAAAATHSWIDTDSGFGEILPELAAADAYGLDTEFHRERTYHARLALLQLSWPGGTAVVDPTVVDIAPLATVLDGDGMCLMHAASQDLEILARVCGTLPKCLFDTQVAAGFVGYSSVGLAGLVQGELGVKLPKADRLTDWLARPLSEGAVTYAVADVQHLHELRDRLVAKLEQRGRLSWALDECEVHRIRPTSGQVPDRAWWRIKEARSLRGSAAAVAQVLAAWRERRAAELDRPVRFLLPDLALVAMAQRPPATEDDLRRVRGLDDGKKRGGAARELLAVVAQGLALPLDDVQLPQSEGVDRSRRAAASLVSAWAAQRARDLDIDAAILATRADIESLLMGDGGRLATGWRHDVVGEPIRALAAGEASLAVDDQGRLRLETRSGVPLVE